MQDDRETGISHYGVDTSAFAILEKLFNKKNFTNIDNRSMKCRKSLHCSYFGHLVGGMGGGKNMGKRVKLGGGIWKTKGTELS